MDVQTVLDRITDGDPIYNRELVAALQAVANSRILEIVTHQLTIDFVNMTSIGDEDEAILARIRELRAQTDVLNGIQEAFSQVKQKEADDE